MAATSDEKKSAMLDEMKVAVKQERENISRQHQDINKDKSQLDEYKRIKETENIELKKQLDN